MPWMETNKVEERAKFVFAVIEGRLEVSEACRHFGISRPTGYKWLKRYEKRGFDGLEDLGCTPHRIPHKTTDHVEELLVRARKQHPTWGPKKLRVWLIRRHPDVQFPAVSTMGDVLKRRGLVKPRKRKRRVPPATQPLAGATAANELWSADFKGQFRLGSGDYCYPLTVTDNFSRMALGCFALKSTKGPQTMTQFERVFEKYGLPRRIRTDNGSPFASCGVAGLSVLSAWWVSLGVEFERIARGHPEQNGRHERFHLTLKQETARPAADSFEAQQNRFDAFLAHFNEERPHEALGQETPSSQYEPSGQTYRADTAAQTYPEHDLTTQVRTSGFINFARRDVFVGKALAGHWVGLVEVDPNVWVVSLGHLDLGILGRGETRFSPAETGGYKRTCAV